MNSTERSSDDGAGETDAAPDAGGDARHGALLGLGIDMALVASLAEHVPYTSAMLEVSLVDNVARRVAIGRELAVAVSEKSWSLQVCRM